MSSTWQIDPETAGPPRDPKRDCNLPPLWGDIADRSIVTEPESALDGEDALFHAKWVEVNARELGVKLGIRPQSVVTELKQMARRGTVEFDETLMVARPTFDYATRYKRGEITVHPARAH